ncbi:YhhN-like protein [Ostertagia ostertagi]
MQSVLAAVGAVYFLLVANFYNESHGFQKFYNRLYPVWKVMPIVFLTIFAAVHGGGLSKRNRFMCAMALFFGGIGDVLIGLSDEGIVTGAIAFAIGHLFYMPTKIFWPLLIGTFAWGAVLGHFCVFPMLNEHPFEVLILSTYSLILSSCLAITGSHIWSLTSIHGLHDVLHIGFGTGNGSYRVQATMARNGRPGYILHCTISHLIRQYPYWSPLKSKTSLT